MRSNFFADKTPNADSCRAVLLTITLTQRLTVQAGLARRQHTLRKLNHDTASCQAYANLHRSSQNPSLPSTSSTMYGYRSSDRRGSGVPSNMEPVVIETPKKPQCWDHGCNGRQFSTFSNLLRHQREKSGTSSKSVCPRCGAEFTRKTARDGHLAHDKCKARSSSDR